MPAGIGPGTEGRPREVDSAAFLFDLTEGGALIRAARPVLFVNRRLCDRRHIRIGAQVLTETSAAVPHPPNMAALMLKAASGNELGAAFLFSLSAS
jgi:hypothetical protein